MQVTKRAKGRYADHIDRNQDRRFDSQIKCSGDDYWKYGADDGADEGQRECSVNTGLPAQQQQTGDRANGVAYHHCGNDDTECTEAEVSVADGIAHAESHNGCRGDSRGGHHGGNEPDADGSSQRRSEARG